MSGNKQPQVKQEELDPRFLFWQSSTITNPFYKTATLTVTSSVNLTSVQSCIPSAQFAGAAAQNTRCRRKRKIEFFTNDDEQFPIIPTETQT